MSGRAVKSFAVSRNRSSVGIFVDHTRPMPSRIPFGPSTMRLTSSAWNFESARISRSVAFSIMSLACQ